MTRQRGAPMYECKRAAIDVWGRRVELVERQTSRFVETVSGGKEYLAPARFYDSDGRQMISEGDGFYRTKFGVRYKVTD